MCVHILALCTQLLCICVLTLPTWPPLSCRALPTCWLSRPNEQSLLRIAFKSNLPQINPNYLCFSKKTLTIVLCVYSFSRTMFTWTILALVETGAVFCFVASDARSFQLLLSSICLLKFSGLGIIKHKSYFFASKLDKWWKCWVTFVVNWWASMTRVQDKKVARTESD